MARTDKSIPSLMAAAALGLLSLAGLPTASAASYTITVDASSQTAGNPPFWSAAVGTGTASLTLRADLQTHYKIANRELGMQRVRGHGLLNDDMGLYKGPGSYDWTKLDTYLTAITSAGMRPIMELDFMPKALATGGDVHAPPSNYDTYKDFIKALAQHCVDKYGAEDVGSWYWEVWNEPDYPGFWTSTDMNSYYTLYDNTVDALTSVLPNVLVGGPATTEPSKIAAFLKHCKSANKRVTFVSSHVYPGGDGTKTSSTSADAAGLVNDNNTRTSQISSGGYTTSAVKSFNTEWNSSYSGQGGNPADVVKSMDNHWNVGFILKGVKLLSDKNSGDTPPIDVFSYWALSDVFDESSGPSGSYILSKTASGTLPFGQVFGMMTFQGMRKAAFNAFRMLNYLGPKRLKSGGGTGNDGVDAMATKSSGDDEIQILVYNFHKTLNTTGSDSVTVSVSNLPAALAGKELFVTRFLVDETHSNPYPVWEKHNKPSNPSEAQWQEMRKQQHLALAEAVSKKTVDSSFSASFTLNRQAGTLLIIGTKRPLTGRNALVEIEGEDYDGQSNATRQDSNDTGLGQSVSVSSGGYLYFENVDYSDGGVGSVQLRVKAQGETAVELRAESQTGTLLGKCTIGATSNAWATQTCPFGQTVTGVSRLYLVFGGAAQLNWFKFQTGGSTPGSGGAGGNPGSGGSVGGAGGGAGGSKNGGSTGSGGATAKGGSGGSGVGGSGGNNTAKGGAGGNQSSAGGASGGSGGSGDGSGGSSEGSGGNGGSGGNAGGSGGHAGSGGNPGSGGTSPVPSDDEATGCSCHIGDAGGAPHALLVAGLVTMVLGLGRRRARRRQ